MCRHILNQFLQIDSIFALSLTIHVALHHLQKTPHATGELTREHRDMPGTWTQISMPCPCTPEHRHGPSASAYPPLAVFAFCPSLCKDPLQGHSYQGNLGALPQSGCASILVNGKPDLFFLPVGKNASVWNNRRDPPPPPPWCLFVFSQLSL